MKAAIPIRSFTSNHCPGNRFRHFRGLLLCFWVTALLLAALWPGRALSQNVDVFDDGTALHRNHFPRMVQEYFVQQLRQIEEQGDRVRAAIETREQAEQYVREARDKIQQSFAPWPEKTPLNPRIVKTIERDAYRIENVIFESRPQFYVTANLYIPKGRSFPLPAVLGTCGHSNNGKASEYYQSFCQGLARQGYVVLIYDPLGQGERYQYLDENLKPKLNAPTREHLFAGNQQFLVGESIASWRAWDGIRALDYLLTREEVDPDQVAVTGNSGGGTMTTWLCGVERRFSMGAPSCFVTRFRRNMENELPADTEQCPPRALSLGLDHLDFLAAMAPKPVILLAKEKDYFDVRGSEEAYRQLQGLYRYLNAEQNIGFFAGPTAHGYSQENREAMYRWFNRHTRISNLQDEPGLEIEADSTLYCTASGQVAELGSRTVFSFTRDKSMAMAQSRPKEISAPDLKKMIHESLRLDKYDQLKQRDPVPEYRIYKGYQNRSELERCPYPKHYTTYGIETEPGIQAVVYRLFEDYHYSRPPQGPEHALLYVSHLSSDQELCDEPLIKELIAQNPESAFYTCDVRGSGESRPNTCGSDAFFSAYGSDYFYAIHSIMLDWPYPGQKTLDILRVIDWLGSFGHERIHLVAKGWGAVPATFAAVLAEPVTQVTLKNALTSYSDIAGTEYYDWPLSCFVPQVLHYFDLPDCYALLEKEKNLKQVETWGAVVGER